MSVMQIPDVKSIKSKEQARDTAIEWQHWASEQSLYMSELAEWGDFFRVIGKKYGLIREFKENGIL